jgi:hypothetical protein
MAAAGGGGGPAEAQGGSEREPVLEIYTQNGLEPYIMKPVGKGTHLFGEGSKAPNVKDRVKLHSELIAFGVLHPVLGDPDFQFLKEMPFDRSITMPHLNNDNYQLIRVFDNHKILDKLKSIYTESVEVDSSKALEYFERIREMAYRPFRSIWSPGKRNDLNRISVKVVRRVKSILKAAADAAETESNMELTPDEIKIPSEFEAGDAAAAAEAHSAGGPKSGQDGAAEQGGGSRRRRGPSRKYKKSKRVLRRKSRSTRRR